MASILDFVREQITPETINSISAEIGEDSAKTRQAVDASLPLLAGAISTQEAATATGDIPGQPAMFGGLSDMLSGGGGAAGAGGLGGVLGGILGGGGGGMLDSILGASKSSTEAEISRKSGIEPEKVMRILTMLAPVVLAAYSRYKQDSPGSLNPSKPAQKGGGGTLGDIIDRVT